jgi:hypothetical protein
MLDALLLTRVEEFSTGGGNTRDTLGGDADNNAAAQRLTTSQHTADALELRQNALPLLFGNTHPAFAVHGDRHSLNRGQWDR